MTDLSAAPSTARLTDLARHSHALIAAHQDASGAYPASPTFSAYRGYAWFRDGSFTAEGMSRWGDAASAERFHDWCARVVVARRERVTAVVAGARRGEEVPVGAMLPTRYTLAGEEGDDPWWDFQTDGYGMWLWSLVAHAERHGADLTRWAPAVGLTVDYLTATWTRPCYDWWEEHVEHRHVSTLAAVRAGLLAVARSGLLDAARHAEALAAAAAIEALVLREGVTSGRAGDPTAPHLAKWLGAATVDASLAACVVPFGLVPPGSPLAAATLDAVARDLDVDGGVHRFRDDVFYGGGQWTLLSCLLGWNLAAVGDTDGALRHLDWVADQAVAGGDLPEQVPGHLLHPSRRQEWLDRWGPVATPLLWSHGMVLILADELGLLPEETLR
jgi:GH15 family glucan-1,4-alpha-glucosidase